MNLKNCFLIACIFTTFSIFAQDKYEIETKTSIVEWIGEKVTGSHTGTVKINKGHVLVDRNAIINGKLEMDMTSIIVTDITNESSKEKLQGHLNSPDFFSIEKFPTAKLKIIEVKPIKGNSYSITAELTIKDITEKVQIPATILMEENKLVVIGEAKIDRTKFDIRYGSGSFFDNLGDKAIDNIFTIKFQLK